jgi:hypothetical protein
MSSAKASSQSFRATKEKNFVKIDTPIYGAIVVLALKKNKTRGHVAFVYAEDVHLGGNQSDSINFGTTSSLLREHELMGYYVPTTYHGFALECIRNGETLPRISSRDLNKKFGSIAPGSKTI